VVDLVKKGMLQCYSHIIFAASIALKCFFIDYLDIFEKPSSTKTFSSKGKLQNNVEAS
jgi:hypothetical protein